MEKNAIIEIIREDGRIFSNTNIGDLIFHVNHPSQRMIFGLDSNNVLSITDSNLYINNDTVVSNQVLIEKDNSAYPGFTWTDDSSTGMYYFTSNIGWSLNGIKYMNLNENELNVENNIYCQDTILSKNEIKCVDGLMDTNLLYANEIFTYNLDVSSNIVISNSNSTESNPSIFWENDMYSGIFHPETNNIGISTDSSERLRISSNGYIGINTKQPKEQLHVAGNMISEETIYSKNIDSSNVFVNNIYSSRIFTDDISTETAPSYSWSNDENTGIFHPESNTIGFTNDSLESMRISSNGFIGVNTKSPTERLDVNGNIKSADTIYSKNKIRCPDGAIDSSNLFVSNIYSGHIFTQDIEASSNVMVKGYSSETDPSYTWDNDIDTGIFHPESNTIGFTNGSIESMRISSNGYIGINTSNPTEHLHVEGNVYISGELNTSANNDNVLPIGSIVTVASSNTPSGRFLKPNGQEISRTEYDELFDVIGTEYGNGDGSTTFNIPKVSDERFATTQGASIFAADANSDILRIDPVNMTLIDTYTQHTDVVNQVVSGKNNYSSYIFSCSSDGTVHKINKSDLSQNSVYSGYNGAIYCIYFGDDNYLYFGGTDKKIFKLNPNDMSKVSEYKMGRVLRDIIQVNDVLYAIGENEVHKIDSVNMEEIVKNNPGGAMLSLAYMKGYVYVGNDNSTILQLETNKLETTSLNYTIHSANVTSLISSQDGYLYSGDANGEIHKIEPLGLTLVDSMIYDEFTSTVNDISWAVDIYACSGNGEIHKIDPLSFLTKNTYSHSAQINDLYISIQTNALYKYIKY